MRGRKRGEQSGGCRICALKASDPLRVESLENRLALGERQCDLVKEYGFDRFRIRRHWAHCNQTAVLRRVHKRDREATPRELLEMTAAERERPLMLCRRQIGIYIEEFERARAAGDAAARDAADRRLFQWAHLEHRILTPLAAAQVTNVQNNILVDAASGSAGFGVLFAEFERRLALHPPEKRAELIEMLRGDAFDGAAE
jgi:hypothetical protein